MDSRLIALVLAILAVLPVASADLIPPGEKYVPVNNTITNIGDFPDYVFVSVGTLGGAYAPNCPARVISLEGEIPLYYKFCEVSVYAIPKSQFNESKIIKSEEGVSIPEYDALLESMQAKKVLTGIVSSRLLPESSAVDSIENKYAVDLAKVQEAAYEVEKERNWTVIAISVIVSLLALTAIVMIIRRNG